ncbi:MAG: hypothetical protein K2F79_00030, partial [Muribaculaceae bacterium]|nr:hypothetical protein [Muribaculaceae bacterium]
MDIKHPVAAALALFAAGFFLGRYADSRVAPPGRIAVLTRTDTLVVEIPAPARSSAAGIRKARLPLSEAAPSSEPDSATVDIPVISAVYE